MGSLLGSMWDWNPDPHSLWLGLLAYTRKPGVHHCLNLVALGHLFRDMRGRDAAAHAYGIGKLFDLTKSKLWLKRVPHNSHSYLDYHNSNLDYMRWHVHHHNLNSLNVIGYNRYHEGYHHHRGWRGSCGRQLAESG